MVGLLVAAGLVIATMATVLAPVTSRIKPDEKSVFFPGCAHLDVDRNTWTVPIHGVIFEPSEDSVRRNLAVAALRGWLDIQPDTPEARTFDRRARLFMVDHERGKRVSVRIGQRRYELGPSGANGHFRGTVQLAAADARRLLQQQQASDGWISFQAITPSDDQRRFTGRVQLIGRWGWSLISDVDDTIKVTEVRDRKAMLANTFLREFKPVAGMAELYRDLARRGVVFHYVSGSPWQLYGPLADFRRTQGFPEGSFHLKHFRLTDSSVLNLLGSQQGHKLAAIEPILAAFPGRRFILIGDSGEQDPEIYGKIARRHGDQIAAICIRNVTGESAEGKRFQDAFEGIQPYRWTLFHRPEELRQLIRETTRSESHATERDSPGAAVDGVKDWNVGRGLRRVE